MANNPSLGFGLMRLPQKDDAIDYDTLKKMVDTFIESGFDYFDTAYMYHGGESEKSVMEVLTKRHKRESFRLATKMTVAALKNKDDVEKVFAEQLARTGAEYFDNYLLHAVDGGKLDKFNEYGLWDFLRSLKEKGLARRIGFSFHDTADVLDAILTEHPYVDFVQLQMNYADWDSSSVQSRLNYETAYRKHSKSVIVMEPVKGGMLVELSESVKEIFLKADSSLSLPSWALRFVGSLDGVELVLSGMSNMEQLNENIAIFKDFKALSDHEKSVVSEVMEAMKNIPSVPCTRCGYCLTECPVEIPISNLLAVLNSKRLFGLSKGVLDSYSWYSRNHKASECVKCGACTKMCPQHIDIPAALEELSSAFD